MAVTQSVLTMCEEPLWNNEMKLVLPRSRLLANDCFRRPGHSFLLGDGQRLPHYIPQAGRLLSLPDSANTRALVIPRGS
jgi:hypothetical protein